MKEYVLKDKVIVATEKAYNLLYKGQGYLPKETKKENKTDKTNQKETKKENE